MFQSSQTFLYYLMISLNNINFNSIFIFLSFFFLFINGMQKLLKFLILVFSFYSIIIQREAIDNKLLISLIYGYNNIHPFLFYISVIFIAWIFFINLKIFYYKSKYVSIILTIALLLGMYWGSVNDGWGFFWTNDSIEYILLFLLFLNVVMFHTVKFKQVYFLNFFSFYLLLVYIMCVRLNVVFSVHSFFLEKNFASFYLYMLMFIIGIYYVNSLFLISYWLTNYIVFATFSTFIIYLSMKYLIRRTFIFYFHLFFFFIIFFFFLNNHYFFIISYSWTVSNTAEYFYSYFISSTSNLTYLNLKKHEEVIILLYRLYFYNYFSVLVSNFNFFNYFFFIGFFYYVYISILISNTKIYNSLNTKISLV